MHRTGQSTTRGRRGASPLAVGVAAVLLTVAGCTSQPIRTADSPDPTFSASPAPRTTPLPLARYVQLVDRSLQEAADSYLSFDVLHADLVAGRRYRDLTLPTRDHTTLVHSELIKQQQLSYVRTLIPPVRARQVHTLLLAAFQAAIAANVTEVRWINFVLVHRYSFSGGALRWQIKARADLTTADGARTTFLQSYGELRSGAGLPPLPPGMVF
jgi:hypothetical protein